VGVDVYLNLKRKVELVDWNKENRKECYILFSKSGFTEDMMKLAKKEKVKLVKEDKIIRR
ncbi:MAG: ATP-binding protein, partial [Patescibacteria group bacterium]